MSEYNGKFSDENQAPQSDIIDHTFSGNLKASPGQLSAYIVKSNVIPIKSKSTNKKTRARTGQSAIAVPEPWAEPVDGAQLLSDIAAAIKRHAALPPMAAELLTLWGVGTHAMQQSADIFPRLLISSIDAECGKTLILELLAAFSCKSVLTDDMSAPAIYRLADAEHPTFLLDEADTWLNEHYRALLNSGHKKGGAIWRCEGDDFIPTQFRTYAAVAIARIGSFSGQFGPLITRSIVVRVSRSLPEEHRRLHRFTDKDRATFHDYGRKVQRWLRDCCDPNPSPKMPDFLIRRSADNWRFLFAIAEAAGGDWPRIARETAEAFGRRFEVSNNVDKRGVMSAVKAVLQDHPLDRIRTLELCQKLGALEGFGEAFRFKSAADNGDKQAGRLLRDKFKDFVEIGPPQKIRFGERTSQGYYLEKFNKAFARYDIKTIEELEEEQDKQQSPDGM